MGMEDVGVSLSNEFERGLESVAETVSCSRVAVGVPHNKEIVICIVGLDTVQLTLGTLSVGIDSTLPLDDNS